MKKSVNWIVLAALMLSLFINYDFDSWKTWLTLGLIALVCTSILRHKS